MQIDAFIFKYLKLINGDMKNINRLFCRILHYFIIIIVTCSFSGCDNGQKTTTTSSSPENYLTAPPKPTPTPYPENFHPGYKIKLPEGAIYHDKKIIFTAPKPTYLEIVSDQLIDFTDYFTIPEMIDGLKKYNKTKYDYLVTRQKVIIDKVRMFPPNPHTIVKPKTFDARGVYITRTVAGSDYIFKIMAEMKKLKMNTMVIDAKDMDGHLAYKSNIPLAKEIGATGKYPSIRDLKKLIEKLHNEGFHVVMRQTLFHDQLLPLKKPQYAPKSKSTGLPWKEMNRLVWVDPSNKDVQDYHFSISKELAQMGVDEIQYDYVRFPAWGNTKDAKYSFDEGKIKKHEIITEFLKKQRENLAPYQVLMSADVYGVVAWDQDIDIAITGQKLSDMVKYLDVISPMLYPSHFFPPFDGYSNPGSQPYHFLNVGVKRVRKKAEGTDITVRPWLQAFPFKAANYGPDYIVKQIKATNDAYSAGWLLWNAWNNYKVAFKGIATLKGKYPLQVDLDKKRDLSPDKGIFMQKTKD